MLSLLSPFCIVGLRMSEQPDRSISDNDIAAFRESGVICLKGAFGAHWIDTLAAGIERNLREPGPMAHDYTDSFDKFSSKGRFFGDYCNWQRIPEYRDFILNSPAAEIAAAVMESAVVQIYHEHVLVKEPETTEPTPWHHDLPYYNVEGMKTLSIWLTLDPVEVDVCPRFVAGSHRWGKLFYPRLFKNSDNYDYAGDGYEPVPDIDAAPDDYKLLFWELQPGDALLFNFLTLHNGPPNPTINRRRGFSSRWLGDDVTFAKRPGTTSPPYPGIDLKHGDRMRTDWFPVVWPLT